MTRSTMRSLQSEEDARNWLFRLLSRRSCTVREAWDQLKRHGVGDSVAKALILEAQAMDLLNDAAYARLFAGSHESWGDSRISYELGHRGLSDDDIQAGLEDIMPEDKRLRPLVSSWQQSGLEERKIIARLYRRGFSGRAIRAVCQSQDDFDFDDEE